MLKDLKNLQEYLKENLTPEENEIRGGINYLLLSSFILLFFISNNHILGQDIEFIKQSVSAIIITIAGLMFLYGAIVTVLHLIFIFSTSLRFLILQFKYRYNSYRGWSEYYFLQKEFPELCDLLEKNNQGNKNISPVKNKQTN